MTSDQSVTSGSSQVRQFGLYRTIDARTEEFLRLSRKRQIRQGCACAAISTAITVTIIVTILLVFELNGIPHEDHKTLQKWQHPTNSTAEEILFNKPGLNIDKATLKMLPILIKALKKNKLIDKIFDDFTTPRSVYERLHTTEFTFMKNVFSPRNNWIRYPTSRLFAIEYKSSPIVYYKTPKNDYFTKIRKIRDYQRIMNYVDKMISDRVTFGSTQPIRRNEDYVLDEETRRKVTKPLAQYNFNKGDSVTSQILNITTEKIMPKDYKTNNCKCPKKINEILNNLLSNIRLLMPRHRSKESKFLKNETDNPCNKANSKIHTFSSSVSNFNAEQSEHRLNRTTTQSPQSMSDLKVNIYNQYVSSKLSELKRDHALKTIVNLLQPKFLGKKFFSFKSPSKYINTTPPMYIEGTETNEETVTEPISKQDFDKYYPLHLINRPLNNKIIPLDAPTTIVGNEGNEEDSSVTTKKDDNLLNLNVHSLEQVKKKTKVMKMNNPDGNIKIEDINKKFHSSWYDMRNDTKVDKAKIFYPIATLHYLYHRHNATAKHTATKTRTTGELMIITTSRNEFIPSITSTISAPTSTLETTTKAVPVKPNVELETKSPDLNLKPKEVATFRSEEISLDDDFEKIMIEENYQENDYKDRHTEYSTTTVVNDFIVRAEEKDNKISKSIEPKDKDDFFFTSMALYNKPRSYLEIQRNDVKHEENYDLNFNHIFD